MTVSIPGATEGPTPPDTACGELRERILERLDARFVFVTGKGGVGKSTTAAALALHAARSGTSTRLLSTDPAHSVADVFDVPLNDAGGASGVCGVPLDLEAFDAAGYAERWISRASEPIGRLFELGTYLDDEDVGSFLDLSLPALDEVMAALRLGELEEGGAGMIFVDTAPTGHALRMLDSGDVLSTWVKALHAMSRKATAVAESLTRRHVSLAADRFVDELEAGIERFEDRVLRKACFVTVTRPYDVVREETERLVDGLRQRECRVCATISVGDGPLQGPDGSAAGGKERFRVPLRLDLQGCEGLSQWGRSPDAGRSPAREPERPHDARGVDPATRAPPAAPSAGPPPEQLIELLDRPILLFAGKGGVGKSTCAAATAVVAAEQGPVTLVSVDPAGSLEAIFGPDALEEGRATGRLALRQVDATAAFDRFLRRRREEVERILEGLGVGREAVLDREVMEALMELAPPGIDEIFALTLVMDLLEEGEGSVIVDAAPTGHFLRLIRMPDLALDWVHRIMRVLLKYRSVAGLEDTGRQLLELADRLKRLRSRLTDPSVAAAVLVSLEEPVVLAESRRLSRSLREAGIHLGARVYNRTPRGRTVPGEHSGASGDAPGFVAPELDVPPRGVERLRSFACRWESIP